MFLEKGSEESQQIQNYQRLNSQNDQSASAKERISITGIGLVSPLGGTAWESILAIHVGETNFIPHKKVMVIANNSGTKLRAATVSMLDELSPWLDGTDRALALLKPALKECTAGLSPDTPKNAVCEIDNFITPGDPDFYASLKNIFPNLPLNDPDKKDKVAKDMCRCAFFERIIKAAERLQANQIEMALIGCVDSNAAYKRLDSLEKANKLGSALNPTGIVAGEAAGALLLETESHARKRNAIIYGYIASWARTVETKKWTVKSPTVGHGLSDAFFEALCAFEDEGQSINRVVMDVNGESHRAEEWAISEVRVFTRPGTEPYLSIPVFHTGDCGGASGAVVMMDAVGCLMLDKNAPERIALGTSDDAGPRRVICLEKDKSPQADPKAPLSDEAIARKEFFEGLREKYNGPEAK